MLFLGVHRFAAHPRRAQRSNAGHSASLHPLCLACLAAFPDPLLGLGLPPIVAPRGLRPLRGADSPQIAPRRRGAQGGMRSGRPSHDVATQGRPFRTEADDVVIKTHPSPCEAAGRVTGAALGTLPDALHHAIARRKRRFYLVAERFAQHQNRGQLQSVTREQSMPGQAADEPQPRLQTARRSPTGEVGAQRV